VGGANPVDVFEKLFLVKKEHETLAADSLTKDTQDNIPACVK